MKIANTIIRTRPTVEPKTVDDLVMALGQAVVPNDQVDTVSYLVGMTMDGVVTVTMRVTTKS